MGTPAAVGATTLPSYSTVLSFPYLHGLDIIPCLTSFSLLSLLLLLRLRVGSVCWVCSDERRETDDGAGRDAEADADEEHHGLRQHEEGVLHLHPQHHSGRRRPHTGKHRIPRTLVCTTPPSSIVSFCFISFSCFALFLPPRSC